MKKLVLTFSFIASAFIIQANTIKVKVADYSFTPNIFNCIVGDTVKFIWKSGTHTTTSLSVPTGAAPWDTSMSSASQTFVYVVKVSGDYSFDCSIHPYDMKGSFTAAFGTGISPVANENSMLQVVNPASQSIHATVSLPETKNVSIGLYDLTGKFLMSLLNVPLSAGMQHLSIPLNENVASGLYILKVQIGDLVLNRKLVIHN